jgi:beta-galactosidase
VNTRRKFLQSATTLAMGASLRATAADARIKASSITDAKPTTRVSLNGLWQFHLDSDKVGQTNGWYQQNQPADAWQDVIVPHTWQVSQESAEYFGTAWYRRQLDVPRDWRDQTVRIEFEGVFHSATAWLNGSEVGKHLRKGYTAFEFDITHLLHPGADNLLAVMVNSDFDSRMLPRGHSSDWTHDGGIYRPVTLLITPRIYIERVDVDAVPDLANGFANVDISVVIRNSSDREFKGRLSVHAIKEDTGLTVPEGSDGTSVDIAPGAQITRSLPTFKIEKPKLWHFDAPNLYSLTVGLGGAAVGHEFTTTFGIRSIEAKDGSFWLNGERLGLMGVERMAGSNPNYGMAEPASWIEHDHGDLKNLNCVFTRVHWPQDKRVLDYCDRHGIFIQTEEQPGGPIPSRT